MPCSEPTASPEISSVPDKACAFRESAFRFSMTAPDDKTEVEVESEAMDDHSKQAAADESSPSSEDPPAELTPEEQMALYEESLKDTDWGHQPC